jgi:hypothetical protein
MATNPRHAQRGARIFFEPEVLSMPFRFLTVPVQSIAEAGGRDAALGV